LEFSSPGIQSTTVDAINTFAVREQVESMYAHIDGFSFISVSPIFEKKKYSRPEESYKQDSTNSGDSDDISTMIGAGLSLLVQLLLFWGCSISPLAFSL
jgi:hypothetical protein